jgi:hypothetical protein
MNANPYPTRAYQDPSGDLWLILSNGARVFLLNVPVAVRRAVEDDKQRQREGRHD